MSILPVQRGTSGGATTLPIAKSELVDIDYLNAGALVIARKLTVKDVVNTTSETDLLNGEITLPGGALGTKGLMRLKMWGDAKFNAGTSQNSPRFKLKIGSGPTTVFDTNVVSVMSSSAGRLGWRALVEILNLNSAGSQMIYLESRLAGNISGAAMSGFTTGEGILLSTAVSGGGVLTAEGYNSGAFDTTADQAVQFTVTLGSSTGTDIQLIGAVMEIV